MTDQSSLVRHLRGRLPMLAAVVLAALILLDCLHCVVSIRRILVVEAAPRPPPGVVRRFHPEALQRAHLFGESPAAASRSAAATATARDWLLSGTIATSDPADGWAILGERAHPGRLQRAGGELDAGTRLAQIFTDHVVLEINGRQEVVNLPHALKVGTVRVAGSEAAPAAPMDAAALAALVGDPPPSRAEAWFTQFSAQSHPVNGQFVGLELHPGGRYRRLYHLGDGDLVTAINGVPVTDEESAANALRQVGGATVALTVNRAGQQFTTTIKLPREN